MSCGKAGLTCFATSPGRPVVGPYRFALVGRDHRARRTVGRGVPPSRCSLNRGALSLRNLSGIARPPHYTDGRFFAIYFCKAVPGNASDIAQTPVFIGL